MKPESFVFAGELRCGHIGFNQPNSGLDDVAASTLLALWSVIDIAPDGGGGARWPR